jgi:O-antigen/teichoic acid export membrane protein
MSDQNVSTRSQLYWFTLLKIPTHIVAFVISILVARILDPNDFGIMGIAMMLIGYANLFTDFGLSEAVIQKGIRDYKTLTSIFTLNLAFSIGLAILFYASAEHIAVFFNSAECEDVIKVMSSVFIISSFATIPYAILRRDMNFKTLALVQLNHSLLMSFITLFLALYNYGYWALAFGQLVPSVLMAVYVCFRVRWMPGVSYNYSAMKPVMDFGVWNFLKTQLGFVAQHTDRFIIGRWLGTTSLGLYDKALTTAETPYNSVTMNINGVMFSAFSKIREDKKLLRQQFKKSLALLSFINFPIYFGILVIAPYFVISLLGEKWAPMIIPFQIILFSYLFKTFSGMIASLNVGIGQYRNHTIRFFISWLAFIAACFFLLDLDIPGIALAYLVHNLCFVILCMNLSLKSIELSWKDALRVILPGAIASLFMLLVTWMITYFLLPEYTFANMIFIIIAGAFAYCGFILLDKSYITKDLREVIFADIKKIFASKHK